MTHAYAGDWPARLWSLVPAAARVQELRHELALLPRGLPTLRLAFLSDLHIGPTTARCTLDRAFARVTAARPDVLLLGGDYVFLEATAAKLCELSARVRDVPARTKLAVLGNHDVWTHHADIEAALEDGGARVLTNAAAHLPEAHDAIAVLGIDDPQSGAPDARAAARDCPDAEVRIAVCHSPDGLPLLAGEDIALLLCGHTHGGQIAAPWGPLWVPGRLGARYPHGLHDAEGIRLFVSRGIGGVSLPVRLFAPPDVAIIDLVAGEPRGP